MKHPLISENIFLLYSIGMGIFITVIYDVLRIFRRVIPHNNFFISLEDLGFWAFSAIQVFLLMHRESNGTLRWFAVVGALCGMLLYKKTISEFLVKWISKALIWVLGLLGKCLGILAKPFIFMGRGTKKASRYSTSKARQFLRFLKKKLTKLLKMLKIVLCKQ